METTQKEIHRFLSNTSLKGIPRIVGSDIVSLRWVWIVAVCFGILTSGFFTSILTINYFSRSVTVSIREKTVIPEGVGNSNLYLATMICNLNPFTSNNSRYERINVTPEKFFSMVKNATRCDQCSEEDHQVMKEIQHDLLTPSGYYQYVGPDAAREAGHQEEDFIMDCQVVVADGAYKKHKPCLDILHLLHTNVITTPDFLNCIEARFRPVELEVPIVGFSLTLYLDNFHSTQLAHHGSTQWDNGYSAGVHLSFYENTSVPPIHGLDMPAGHVSNIVGNLQRRTRLSAPYGTCRAREDIIVYHRGNKVEYSKRVCQSICFERAVYEHCACVDVRSSCLMEERYVAEGAAYCQSLVYGIEFVRDKTKCASNIRARYRARCTEDCPQPCDEIIYNSRVFQAKWPEVMHHAAFYDDVIKNKAFSGRFKVYENFTPNSYGADQHELVTYAPLIQNNFAKIKFSINDPRFDHMEDQAKTSLSELVSQLGGILNLWSGITFLLLIEILDMIFRVFHSFCRGRDTTKSQERHKTEVIDVNGSACFARENPKAETLGLNVIGSHD